LSATRFALDLASEARGSLAGSIPCTVILYSPAGKRPHSNGPVFLSALKGYWTNNHRQTGPPLISVLFFYLGLIRIGWPARGVRDAYSNEPKLIEFFLAF